MQIKLPCFPVLRPLQADIETLLKTNRTALDGADCKSTGDPTLSDSRKMSAAKWLLDPVAFSMLLPTAHLGHSGVDYVLTSTFIKANSIHSRIRRCSFRSKALANEGPSSRQLYVEAVLK